MLTVSVWHGPIHRRVREGGEALGFDDGDVAVLVAVVQSTRRMIRLLEDLLATARTRSEAFTDRDVDVADLASKSVTTDF